MLRVHAGGSTRISAPLANSGTFNLLGCTLSRTTGPTNLAAQTLTGGTFLLSGSFLSAGADFATDAATVVISGATAGMSP